MKGQKRTLLLVLATMLAAACNAGTPAGGPGPAPSSATGTGSPATPTPTTTPTPTPTAKPSPTPPVATRLLHEKVYLLRGETLVPAQRTVAVRGGAVATAAVTALLRGPTAAERAAGISSTVPSATRLNGISIAGGTADVDLTAAYASGGGSLSMTARLAQVVYTVTQFPTVRSVVFRLDGRRVTAFGGEGIVLDRPVTRARFTSMLPPIFIDSPARGATVTSPVTVTGVANVFEGQFLVEVRGQGGRVLARGSGHAAMGMFAPFRVVLRFPVTDRQPGTVVGYDLSAKDGSVIDRFQVPVTLATSALQH